MVGMNGMDAISAYQSNNTIKESEKTSDYGKTIGEPKLSDKAQKYYEKLKKQYGNYDFILVSEDQKANAQANASKYANQSKTVVLIDEDKIERMASDESYRKKYEGILSGATQQLQQLKEGMANSNSNVCGFGMQVNDGGTTSFFAVLKKSSEDQKARIEKTAEKKKTEKKEAEKKAQKKENEERIEKMKSSKTNQTSEAFDDSDTITLSASSVEELLQKMNDYYYEQRSNQLQTDSEKMLGQHIDFRG